MRTSKLCARHVWQFLHTARSAVVDNSLKRDGPIRLLKQLRAQTKPARLSRVIGNDLSMRALNQITEAIVDRLFAQLSISIIPCNSGRKLSSNNMKTSYSTRWHEDIIIDSRIFGGHGQLLRMKEGVLHNRCPGWRIYVLLSSHFREQY